MFNNIFPITVSSQIIKGKFGWCSNVESENILHHVRTKGDTYSSVIISGLTYDYGIKYYSIRENFDGSGLDYQHTVRTGQDKLIFSLAKYQGKNEMWLFGYDENKRILCRSQCINLGLPFYTIHSSTMTVLSTGVSCVILELMERKTYYNVDIYCAMGVL